jgi:hypothetical protein
VRCVLHDVYALTTSHTDFVPLEQPKPDVIYADDLWQGFFIESHRHRIAARNPASRRSPQSSSRREIRAVATPLRAHHTPSKVEISHQPARSYPQFERKLHDGDSGFTRNRKMRNRVKRQ